MTYTERVQTLAEKFAISYNVIAHIFQGKAHSLDMIPASTIAVEHMADEVKWAMEGSPKSEIDTYLKQRGLIPEKEVRNDLQ